MLVRETLYVGSLESVCCLVDGPPHGNDGFVQGLGFMVYGLGGGPVNEPGNDGVGSQSILRSGAPPCVF